jgi:hypothetical protein
MYRSHGNRPEIQARRLALRQNPEWVRRDEIVRAAKGLFLAHFKKRELAGEWRGEWVRAGMPNPPNDMPEFPEWLESKRAELTLKRDTAREESRLSTMIHRRWVDAGMPHPWLTRAQEAAEAIEEFKMTAKPKLREIAESVAVYTAQFYQPKEEV